MKKLVLPFLLVGLLASCSIDDPIKADSADVPLMISSVITKDVLPVQDSIGILLSDDAEKVSPFVEYLAPGDNKPEYEMTVKSISRGDLASWHAANPKEKHYLNNKISAYKLFVFAPYDRKFDLNTSMKMTPQDYRKSTSDGKHFSDFCYGYKNGVNSKNPEIDLLLQHLYSRITLVIDPSDDVNNAEFKQVDFSGEGIFKTANASFEDFTHAKIIDTKKTSLSDHLEMPLIDNITINSNETYEISFLMIPASTKDFSGSTTLFFKIGDKTISGIIPNKKPTDNGLNELLSGIHYKVKVTVSKEELTIGTVEITDWTYIKNDFHPS